MNKTDSLIDSFLDDLQQTKRVTQGRDTRKNYHKITISVNQADKNAIQTYAKEHNISVSALIKGLLEEKNIIMKLAVYFKHPTYLCSIKIGKS